MHHGIHPNHPRPLLCFESIGELKFFQFRQHQPNPDREPYTHDGTLPWWHFRSLEFVTSPQKLQIYQVHPCFLDPKFCDPTLRFRPLEIRPATVLNPLVSLKADSLVRWALHPLVRFARSAPEGTIGPGTETFYAEDPTFHQKGLKSSVPQKNPKKGPQNLPAFEQKGGFAKILVKPKYLG